MLEDGPSDGEYKSYTPESEGGPSGSGCGHKKRPWKEVPDKSWWDTCFSLFQMAWVIKEPEMLGAVDGLQRSDSEDGKTSSVVPRGKIRPEILAGGRRKEGRTMG